MSHQLTFADCQFNGKRRKTRKEAFLARIEALPLWGIVAQISHYATTSPAPGDSYTWGFLTGRPRAFSLFIAHT